MKTRKSWMKDINHKQRIFCKSTEGSKGNASAEGSETSEMLFVGSNHDGLVIKDTLGLSVAFHQSQNNRDSQIDNKLEAPIAVKLPDPALGFDHPLETHTVDVPLLCSAPVSLYINE